MRSNKLERRSSLGMSACICGLDVHKESTYATILTPEGKIVDQMKMSNEKVLSYLSRFNVGKVAMESSNQVAASGRSLESKGYTMTTASILSICKVLNVESPEQVFCFWV